MTYMTHIGGGLRSQVRAAAVRTRLDMVQVMIVLAFVFLASSPLVFPSQQLLAR